MVTSRISRVCILSVLFLFLIPNTVFSEDKKPEEEKIQTGVAASFGRYKGAASVNSTSLTSMDEEKSPISGSIMRKKNRCVARLTNNGKQRHSVRFRVIISDATGHVSSKRSYSASIAPGKTTERSVSCEKGSNAQIEIRGGK